MAKRITIQHYYTTGSTAPSYSALTLGEIAMSTAKNNEGIYFRNNEDDVVKVLTSGQTRNMILETAGSIEGFNEHIEHKANNRPENEGNNPYGHVKLVDGNLSGKYQNYNDAGDGVAASAYHFHNQYFSFLDSGKGLTTLIGSEENGHPNEIGFGIDDVTYNKITGATSNEVFTAHTENKEVHVSKELQDKWNDTTTKFNAFISGDTNEALDTLVEIQDFLSGDTTGSVNLISKVNANTTNINTISGKVSTNTDDISANTKDINSLKNDKVGFISVEPGDNLMANIDSSIVTDKAYKIKHTTASTQSSAITATNTASTLNFGDTFEFVNKIGYDKNGHVVSGDTQTLTLPSLLTGDTRNNFGVVTLFSGDINPQIVEGTSPNIPTGVAASVTHWHSDYIKFNDLYSGNTSTGNTITISCGIY